MSATRVRSAISIPGQIRGALTGDSLYLSVKRRSFSSSVNFAYFDKGRAFLALPPRRPAAFASFLVQVWAFPIACAAFPPAPVIRRTFSLSIEASPRLPLIYDNYSLFKVL